MPRLDIKWGTGVEVREQTWGWRSDITCQVVNPDIDGLLTACLLHHLKGWPVIGFYDTQRLMLDPSHPLPLDLDKTIWVDIDMCWPGARSLSQHVITDSPNDAQVVSAYAETVNPSLLAGHARLRNYTSKYPFGTFQWAWWLIGSAARSGLPDPNDPVMTGLAWMPDGGFQSVEGRWRDNCLAWATQRMHGSILEPLARTEPDRSRAAVVIAEAELRRRSGVEVGWRNHQFNLTRASSGGPRLNFSSEETPEVLQAMCDSIASLYGWKPPRIPTSLDVHSGRWRSGSAPPSGWPAAADDHQVVSLAVTAARRFCWTEPGELADVLGTCTTPPPTPLTRRANG